MIFTRSQSSCQSQSYIKDFVDKRLQAPSQAYTIAVLYWCLDAYHPQTLLEIQYLSPSIWNDNFSEEPTYVAQLLLLWAAQFVPVSLTSSTQQYLFYIPSSYTLLNYFR